VSEKMPKVAALGWFSRAAQQGIAAAEIKLQLLCEDKVCPLLMTNPAPLPLFQRSLAKYLLLPSCTTKTAERSKVFSRQEKIFEGK